ncbi:MAG: hypothetical protein K5857_08275 [Lachnospiraceae bacterium]|nr:hypothetical protein [Lachnospiraceae bacterium]
MNKNFENEYKKYADSAVPDLWSRIESGIDALEEDKSDKIVNIKDYNDRSEVKKVKIHNLKPYFGALAACACVMLILFVTKNVKNSSESAATAMEAAPAAMAESAEATVAMDEDASYAAEEAEEYKTDDAVMEEAAEYSADDMAAEEAAPAEAAEEYEAAETADAAEEYEEAAPTTETNGASAGSYDSSLTADMTAETFKSDSQAISSMKEKTQSTRDAGKEITLYAVPDITSLKDDGSLEIKITDPVDSGLKKNEIIRVNILMDDKGRYINDGLNIKEIDGSESRMYKVTLKMSEAGKYTLTAIE